MEREKEGKIKVKERERGRKEKEKGETMEKTFKGAVETLKDILSGQRLGKLRKYGKHLLEPQHHLHTHKFAKL